MHRSDQYDQLTVDVMERVLGPRSNCIDAGAARGDLLREMVRLAPEGTHYAFEPVPQQAAALKKMFPTVYVEELALGDANGTAKFRHVLDSPFNSGFARRKWDTYRERVDIL